MLIAVCLKAAWRTDTALRLHAEGRSVNPDGREPVPDPAARSALGLALSLRKRVEGAGVHALAVAPPGWEAVLREALAWGADRAQRIWAEDWPDRRMLEVDGSAETTRLNARAAATVLRTLEPALVLVGARSGDAAHGCFGAFLAQALGMAYAHRVTEVEAHPGGWRVVAELERGYAQRMELPAPAVLSVSQHVTGPPAASLPTLLRSRAAPIATATVAPVSTQRAATAVRPPLPRVKRYTVPAPGLGAEERIRSQVTLQTGTGGTVLGAGHSPEEQAQAIFTLLREKGFLG
jgi:electron transfer flavoprotein alpha/beta subunit